MQGVVNGGVVALAGIEAECSNDCDLEEHPARVSGKRHDYQEIKRGKMESKKKKKKGPKVPKKNQRAQNRTQHIS